jgi:hypothetical protein
MKQPLAWSPCCAGRSSVVLHSQSIRLHRWAMGDEITEWFLFFYYLFFCFAVRCCFMVLLLLLLSLLSLLSLLLLSVQKHDKQWSLVQAHGSGMLADSLMH